MGAQGSTTIDFGASPGAFDATSVVTGQALILGSSLVEAWLIPVATSDHSVDEHLVDGPVQIEAGAIVAATGFTIYARAPNNPGAGPKADAIRLTGQWSIAWVWN